MTRTSRSPLRPALAATALLLALAAASPATQAAGPEPMAGSAHTPAVSAGADTDTDTDTDSAAEQRVASGSNGDHANWTAPVPVRLDASGYRDLGAGGSDIRPVNLDQDMGRLSEVLPHRAPAIRAGWQPMDVASGEVPQRTELDLSLLPDRAGQQAAV